MQEGLFGYGQPPGKGLGWHIADPGDDFDWFYVDGMKLEDAWQGIPHVLLRPSATGSAGMLRSAGRVKISAQAPFDFRSIFPQTVPNHTTRQAQGEPARASSLRLVKERFTPVPKF